MHSLLASVHPRDVAGCPSFARPREAASLRRKKTARRVARIHWRPVSGLASITCLPAATRPHDDLRAPEMGAATSGHEVGRKPFLNLLSLVVR